VKKLRYFIFLRDILWLSCNAFGGPHAHIALFLRFLVKEKRYITEKDFLELVALCQILPGPSSTQVLTSIGFRRGGAKLAYLTLLVWSLPAFVFMTSVGLLFSYFAQYNISLSFMQFVLPVMVGLVIHSVIPLVQNIKDTKTSYFLFVISALLAFFFRSPYIFPLVMVFGGIWTGFKRFHEQEKEEKRGKLKIEWGNFILFWGVLIFSALLGYFLRDISSQWSLLVRLFENFYRNGSFIYGGGQVLIPVLLTEFVIFKKYLTQDEFLSGYSFSQFVPGPVFSFVAFLGVLSMREYGIWERILGAFMASAGVFLPGTFIIFFVIRFWEQLKKYRGVKASLEGLQACGAGLVLAGAMQLAVTLVNSYTDIAVALFAFIFFTFTKYSPTWLILGALLLGFLV
jgi:chromate transporter